MAFKKEGAEFTDTVRFKDYALSFAAEEASRFSNEDGDGRGSCRLGDRLPPDGGNPADSFFLTGEHA